MKVAVLKGGRSLERGVSLRSGARVEEALERLGHQVIALDVGGDMVKRLGAERPDVAFVAMHGIGGEDGTAQELLEILGIPFTGPGAAACARCMDKVLAKHAMREAGLPTPDWFAFNQTAFRELGAADALGPLEQSLGFPLVVKPSRGGSSLGVKFAASAEEVPQALVAAFSYDERVLLERFVAGRELAVSVLGEEALPVRGRPLRLRGPLRNRPDPLRLPGRAERRGGARGNRGGARHLPGARLHRLRAGRPHSRRGRPVGARGERDPRPDRHQPAATGGRGGRHDFRAAGRANRRPGPGQAPAGARLEGFAKPA